MIKWWLLSTSLLISGLASAHGQHGQSPASLAEHIMAHFINPLQGLGYMLGIIAIVIWATRQYKKRGNS